MEHTVHIRFMCPNLNHDIGILPVVSYGCETWCLTLREEHILRKVLGPTREQITEDGRQFNNKEL